MIVKLLPERVLVLARILGELTVDIGSVQIRFGSDFHNHFITYDGLCRQGSQIRVLQLSPSSEE